MIKKYGEIIRYIIVGGLTTVVSLGTYFICVHTILDANISWQLQIANIISWIACVSFAFVSNRIFVFKSKEKKIVNEILKFVGARVSTLLIDMIFMFVMVTLLKINDSLSKIMVQFIILVLNYIFSKFFVFNKKKEV